MVGSGAVSRPANQDNTNRGEPTVDTQRLLQISKTLLTLGALEFFGPILRDTNSSHLLNPEWAGHARFHLMWNLMLWLCLGIFCLYLIWWRRPFTLSNLYLALILQGFNVVAFWGAVALGPLYAAQVFDTKIHIGFLNVNENIIAFIFFSLLWIASFLLLKQLDGRRQELEA